MPEASKIGKRLASLAVNEEDAASARTKKCPFCHEQILISAHKCKHCGEFLTPAARRAAGLQPAYKSAQKTDVKVPMAEAILCLLFCLPLGIIALVYASQADAKLKTGDTAGAAASAATARNIAAAGLVVGLIVAALIHPGNARKSARKGPGHIEQTLCV